MPTVKKAKQIYIEILQKYNKYIPNYEFYVFDLSNSKNIVHIDKIIKKKKFNIVSCQFALHYFFRSSDSLDTFIQMVTKYMDKNAFFIGTTMDGVKIKKMFRNKNIIEEDIYYFENMKDKNNISSPYGNKYLVSLGKKSNNNKDDHYFVDNASSEYMVDGDELKRVCEKYGLIFVGIVSFSEWYEEYIKNNKKILSDQEKNFSFLNLSFVFKKK